MSTFAKDWVLKTDDELALIAAAAFKLGLEDGRTLSSPIDSYKVLAGLRRLGVQAGGDMLQGHRIKMRQVYGAGFDISKSVAGFNSKDHP